MSRILPTTGNRQACYNRAVAALSPGLRDAGPQRIDTRAGLGLAVVLTGAFVAMLDTFIVNVAVPSIRADLHAGYGDGELVIAGYTLTYAVGQITGSRLGDAYGRRRVFTIGLAAFTLASAICALAPNPAVLITGRLLQGAGAALLTPQVLAIIRVTFPEGRPRARAFAAMGVVLGLASVLGQVAGGLVVEADLWGLTWRPVFLVNLPIGAAAVAAAPFAVRESRAEQVEHAEHAGPAARLDRRGVALSTAALFLLVFPLIEGQQEGWPAWSYAMLAGSAPLFVVFIADQARKSAADRAPLLDTRLFSSRSFSLGAASVFAVSATMPPLYLAFTVLAQTGFGATPFAAAADFGPLALAFSAASFGAGRLSRSGGRAVPVAGASLNVAGACLAIAICLAAPDAGPAALIPALVLVGAGEGFFFTPIFNTVLSGVADRHVGAASGALSTLQRLGNAVGLAVLQIPFLAVYRDLSSSGSSRQSAYSHAFAAINGAVAGLCAVVVVLLLFLPVKRDRPAQAMHGRSASATKWSRGLR